MKPLVPRRDCPQDKGHAGVTPHGLCRDCPAPREDSVSGNRTANRRKRSGSPDDPDQERSEIVGRISASVIRHAAARGYNGGLRSANPPYQASLAENGFRGVDDAHGRILSAIGAEL